MPRAALLVVLLLLGWAGPAAADARLDDFLGPWIGHTVSDAPIERRGTVLIERRGDGGGFAVTWTSFEAEEDGEPTERQRQLAFVPAERAGLWRGEGANDPVGGTAAWAYVAGRTLTINVVAVLADGRLERQVYYRTLTNDGLTLAYRRFLDDEVARALELKYIRLLPPPAK